ncbi:hypothetical protein LLH32_13205 [Bacillus nakamurai]|nr:hypothetical protein [Bacillus nakamurai]
MEGSAYRKAGAAMLF